MAAEKQEWSRQEEENARRQNAAKQKEDEAKRREQQRLQMQHLEEVGVGDEVTSLAGMMDAAGQYGLADQGLNVNQLAAVQDAFALPPIDMVCSPQPNQGPYIS